MSDETKPEQNSYLHWTELSDQTIKIDKLSHILHACKYHDLQLDKELACPCPWHEDSTNVVNSIHSQASDALTFKPWRNTSTTALICIQCCRCWAFSHVECACHDWLTSSFVKGYETSLLQGLALNSPTFVRESSQDEVKIECARWVPGVCGAAEWL